MPQGSEKERAHLADLLAAIGIGKRSKKTFLREFERAIAIREPQRSMPKKFIRMPLERISKQLFHVLHTRRRECSYLTSSHFCVLRRRLLAPDRNKCWDRKELVALEQTAAGKKRRNDRRDSAERERPSRRE